jgi:hypothetical protein
MRSAPPDSASILLTMLPKARISAIDPSTLPAPSRKLLSSSAGSSRAAKPTKSEASSSATIELTLNRAMRTTSPTDGEESGEEQRDPRLPLRWRRALGARL